MGNSVFMKDVFIHIYLYFTYTWVYTFMFIYIFKLLVQLQKVYVCCFSKLQASITLAQHIGHTKF